MTTPHWVPPLNAVLTDITVVPDRDAVHITVMWGDNTGVLGLVPDA